MASFDIYNEIHVVPGLNSGAITTNTTTNGAWIDTVGSYAVMWSIFSATITDGTYTMQLQDSDLDDHSDAALVAADFVQGADSTSTFTATSDNAAKKIGYVGKKRYVRLQVVSTGVTSGGTLSATALIGRPRHAPAAI